MGNLIASVAPLSSLSQQWPPTPTFEPRRDIPDLTGKVAIVTGANSGIGYYTAKELLRKNAKVYLACRDVTKGEEAVKTIIQELKTESADENVNIGEGISLKLDLGDLGSVKEASVKVLDKEERVDILVNNAGVMVPPSNLLTKQGYDLQFGTNVLGHYYFTILLMPAFERSTLFHKEKARVINVSSGGHLFSPGKTGIDWKVLRGGEERDKAFQNFGFPKNFRLYGVSKMGNVLMSNFLARHYNDKIVSCSLNPGSIKTNLQQHLPSTVHTLMQGGLHPPTLGAYTSLFPATVLPANDINGKYFQPWARFGRADPRAKNVEVQDQLKKWLEEQVAAFEETS